MSQPDLHLYTAATMNGYKPVLFLEEVSLPYDLTFVDFSKAEQKAPDYLKLNPNGKIPTLYDRSEDRAIFESSAILWHLAEKTEAAAMIKTARATGVEVIDLQAARDAQREGKTWDR